MSKQTNVTHPRSRTFVHAGALLLALVVAACGRDETCEECGVFNPPETEDSGTMQAFVTDDPASPEPAEGSYDGTIRGRADLEISTDQQRWYIVGDPQEFEAELGSNGRVELTTSGELPADTYRFVRINFVDVEATVEAGSEIGGETLPDDVNLSLGDTRNAIVSADAGAFELGVEGVGDIVLDLNSEVWMTTPTLQNREIPKELFEHAASITIASGS